MTWWVLVVGFQFSALITSGQICPPPLFFVFCLFAISWAAPVACGGSQARGLIGVVATATQDPSHVCNLHHSSQQRWIPNPLSEARDRTRNLMIPSQIR